MTSSSDSLTAEFRTPIRDVEAEVEPTTDPNAVQIVDYRPSLLESLRDSWHARRLLWAVSSTALMAYIMKYRLGPTWILLSVFMPVIGYSLIFGGAVFNVQAPNGMPYFLFLLVGMMGWQLFQSTLTIAARSFLRLRTLVKDLHFPLILVPIAGSSQALLRFFLYLTAYLIAIIVFAFTRGKIYAQLEPKYLALSVGGLFLCVMLAWGISLWTAPLTAHTLDVRMVIRYAIPFWMFVTPVLYPIQNLHGTTRLVAELNPLSSPVEMAKVGLLGVGSVRLYAGIWSVGVIVAVFCSGVWFMNRFGSKVVGLKPAFDDEEEEDEEPVVKMKVRRRKLEAGDELGVDWERWANGRAWRLKRKRHFGDVDPGLAIEAAKNAADRMGKGLQAITDRQYPLKYIWVQFADGKLRSGEPCPCGSRRLLRLHTHFVRCPECGAMHLQGQPGAADEFESRPALRLQQVTGLHLARLGRTDKVDTYRGYGEKDGRAVLVLADFRVDGVEGELRPEDALKRVDRVVIMPLDQLSDLFDVSAFSANSTAKWDLVF
jgi:ABC-type polysaccharide/polyol phosphate export permease